MSEQPQRPGADTSAQTARFYTKSRKFPVMIGRMPEGTRIWGGPYTVTQIMVGVASGLLAVLTRELWSTGGVIVDLLIILGLSWGVAFLSGKLPMSNLNPAVLASSGLNAYSSPRRGRFRGRPIQPRKPHLAASVCLIDEPTADATIEAAPSIHALPETNTHVRPGSDLAERDPRLASISARVETELAQNTVNPSPEISDPTAPAKRSQTGLEHLLAQTNRK